MRFPEWSDQLRDYSATVRRHRGAAIALVGLALAGVVLALGDSLNEAALEPPFLVGGLIAIAGLGLAGYDYSRRSGAVLLERGIWQSAKPVSPRAPVPDPVALIALGSDSTAGDPVVVTHLPAGWLDDLPPEDQAAITAILGRRIQFSEYDADHDGYVEVVFVDDRGQTHFMNVRAELVRRVVT
jgi:hypothetical protein